MERVKDVKEGGKSITMIKEIAKGKNPKLHTAGRNKLPAMSVKIFLQTQTSFNSLQTPERKLRTIVGFQSSEKICSFPQPRLNK